MIVINKKYAGLLAIASALLVWSLPLPVKARPQLPDFTDLIKQVGPAVVNISTNQKQPKESPKEFKEPKAPPQPHGRRMPENTPKPPFDEWFRHFFGEGNEGETPPRFDGKSLGSGFILSKDGYIITNFHVVNGADEIMVRLTDRRELVAELVGSDEQSDVALLKVNAKDLPVLKIGSSEKLKVGEWVLAIGSPFGFDYSATAGIVSAKGRWLPSENYVPFIQTDVAINPGNSGGPLFNLDGEVVGVNSQIYSRTGGFMGLSFAIPIDIAMEVVEQLKARGKVVRGWLGVLIQPVTRELAESFGMDKPEGALVARVLPDSPAEKAGVKEGDIITKFNGQNILDNSDLPPLVGRIKVGSAVDITVMRNRKRQDLKVKIGELPREEQTKLVERSGSPGDSRWAKIKELGIAVSNLSEEVRERLELDKDKQGVIVEKVNSGIAQEAGVRAGDVILMLNSQAVKDVKELEAVLKKLPKGKAVPLLVHRRGGPVFLPIKIP